MNFDVESQLDSILRSVSLLERDGRPAYSISLSRGYMTSVEDLWDAVTNSDRISTWFAPVGGDLQAGGIYRIEGNAGGTITACRQAEYFSLTWEFGGDVSWFEAAFSEEAEGRSRLILTHTAMITPFWDEFGPGAMGVGWELAFFSLAEYLTNPDFQRPDDAEFAASESGRALIIGSSEGWRRAAIEAGVEAAAANAAAGRSTAFWTGEPAPD